MSVCLGLLVLLEGYFAWGLYSGYKGSGATALTPRTNQELAVSMAWKEVLGVPRKRRENPEKVEFEIPVYDYTDYEES